MEADDEEEVDDYLDDSDDDIDLHDCNDTGQHLLEELKEGQCSNSNKAQSGNNVVPGQAASQGVN